MTVFKLFHLTFIYTTSLIIKKEERKSQFFKIALNYFHNKNKLNNKKGDSLKW